MPVYTWLNVALVDSLLENGKGHTGASRDGGLSRKVSAPCFYSTFNKSKLSPLETFLGNKNILYSYHLLFEIGLEFRCRDFNL